MHEILIVIVGVWFLVLRFIWEIIKDSKVRNANKRLEQMRERLTNRSYEQEVSDFIDKNLEHPERLFDLIDDNMRAIYGDGYKNLPELTKGNLKGYYGFDSTSSTQNQRTCAGVLGMIKCLIMSKRGFVPEFFYKRGITVLYTNPYTPEEKKRVDMLYAGQVQKNLDKLGIGVQMVWIKTHKRGADYNLRTRWKHDYLLPFWNDGIKRVTYDRE